MRALTLLAALTAASPAPSRDLLDFRAAPVGIRLAALGHEPLATMRLGPDELVVVVYAPEQGTLSRWDDESRIVLYKRGHGDFERIQFMSKASESLPGRGAELVAQDLDGDGVAEVLAFGGPHGPVGKRTCMVFHRPAAGAKFGVIFRRRHHAPAFKLGPVPRVTFTYETGDHARRFEAFDLRDGYFQPVDGDFRPILHE